MKLNFNLIRVYEGPLYNQAYIDTGDGPVVIFLHGLFGKVGMWSQCIEALSYKFRVIVPRLPIFELPAECTNIHHLSNLLHEFIEWHNLRDVHLVGHAIGGQVALMYAHDHPGNVNRIVLTGSTGIFDSIDFKTDASPIVASYDYIDQRVRSAFYQPDETQEKLVNEIFATLQSTPRSLNLKSLIQSSKQTTVEALLNNLDHRVMLLWGEDDKITPPDVALHFHDFLRNGEIRLIERCGHLPMLEQPDIFTDHLLEFLD